MIRIVMLAGAVILVGVAATLLALGGGSGEPSPVDSWFISPPYPAPPLELPTAQGRPFSLDKSRGRTVVVFFGFTHCPDVCPLTLANLSRAMDSMGEQANEFQVVMVSVDPQRDTPERLRDYVQGFHPDFVALRGEGAPLDETLQAWGIYAGFTPVGNGGEYTVDHTARAYVVDPMGGVSLTLPPFTDADLVAEALSRLVARR